MQNSGRFSIVKGHLDYSGDFIKWGVLRKSGGLSGLIWMFSTMGDILTYLGKDTKNINLLSQFFIKTPLYSTCHGIPPPNKTGTESKHSQWPQLLAVAILLERRK